MAGKDASKQFWKYHNDGILKKYKAKLQVGSLDTKKSAAPPTPPASPPAKKEVAKPKAESGTVSAAPAQESVAVQGETLEPFGDLIPFADPSWYQGVCSSASYIHVNDILIVSSVLLSIPQPIPCRPPRRSP